MDKLWKEWARIRSSSLTYNAGWMMAGSGLGYVLQGIYFVILARLLGALQYGVFVGAFAFVNIVARYGTLGTGTILLRYVSIDRNKFALYWGNLLLVTTVGGLVMTVVVHLVGRHLLNPASAALVMLAALANCFGTQITTCAAQVFQAVEQMRLTAVLNLLTNFLQDARCCCAFAALSSGHGVAVGADLYSCLLDRIGGGNKYYSGSLWKA